MASPQREAFKSSEITRFGFKCNIEEYDIEEYVALGTCTWRGGARAALSHNAYVHAQVYWEQWDHWAACWGVPGPDITSKTVSCGLVCVAWCLKVWSKQFLCRLKNVCSCMDVYMSHMYLVWDCIPIHELTQIQMLISLRIFKWTLSKILLARQTSKD